MSADIVKFPHVHKISSLEIFYTLNNEKSQIIIQ